MGLKYSYVFYSILLFAFVLRIVGICFGLPDLTHADEPIVVNHAVAYGGGDFNPHFFKIPSLLSYLLFFFYGIYFVFGYLIGIFNSVSDFEHLFLIDASSFYVIGRMISGVFFGTATVYAVYFFSYRVWRDQTLALLASFFLATSFLHVRNSHYIYVDIPMTFFVVLCASSIYDLYDQKKVGAYVWAGFWGGVATGFKYNAAVLSLSIIVAHFLKDNRLSFKNFFLDWKLYLCASVMIATYILSNPFSIVDFKKFSSDLLDQAAAEGALPVFFHLGFSLFEGVGLPLLVCSFLGIFWALFKDKKETIVIFSFPFLFYIFCIQVGQEHPRYMIPLLPFLSISSAYFLKHFSMLRFLKRKSFCVYGLSFLVAVPSIMKSLYLNYLFIQQDTRTEAREWIERNIPAHSKIVLDHTFFTPKLAHSEAQLREKLTQTDSVMQKKRLWMLIENSRQKPSYEIFYLMSGSRKNHTFLFSRPVIENNWKALKEKGIQYVIVHWRGRKKTSFFSDVDQHAKIIKTFSPYWDPQKMYSEEIPMTTVAPLLSKELYSRRQLGYTIQIYQML